MENQDLQTIQKRIGYNFINLDLLQQAFVRKSYAKENGGEDNEVLEFIGDKALDIVIVKFLTDKYGFYCHECDDYDCENDFDEYCCECTEGQLTELKKSLVKKETLTNVIDKLRLNQYLIMGKGDSKNNIENEPSVKEDLFEAIIGAVTLDCDWNWDEIVSTVVFMLEPEKRLTNDCENDYVEQIQEWTLKRYNDLPDINTRNSNYYEEMSAGYNVIKAPRTVELDFHVINVPEYSKTHFVSELKLRGIDKIFAGYGKSKSEARESVCELAYHYLEEHGLLFTIQDEIENPNKDDSIGQLEILARRGYFSIPTYDYKQEYDSNGNPIWTCTCHIKEFEKVFESTSSSKKDAKKTAAFEMLEYVLSEEDE